MSNSKYTKNKLAGKTGSSQRRELGDMGEAVAARYLSEKGLTVIERNWRTRDGEIDIVAKDGETLCFIEVRTKLSNLRGHPLATVTGPKQRKIAVLAQRYLQENGMEDQPVRFDVVGVRLDGEVYKVSYIPGAFEARGKW